MVLYSDPAIQSLQREYGSRVIDRDQRTLVQKYLAQCRKRRDRARFLCPACMEIVAHEVESLGWGDECLMAFCHKMFSGADVSQLENFYRRYNKTKHKTSFFLLYVRNEL